MAFFYLRYGMLLPSSWRRLEFTPVINDELLLVRLLYTSTNDTVPLIQMNVKQSDLSTLSSLESGTFSHAVFSDGTLGVQISGG